MEFNIHQPPEVTKYQEKISNKKQANEAFSRF